MLARVIKGITRSCSFLGIFVVIFQGEPILDFACALILPRFLLLALADIEPPGSGQDVQSNPQSSGNFLAHGIFDLPEFTGRREGKSRLLIAADSQKRRAELGS